MDTNTVAYYKFRAHPKIDGLFRLCVTFNLHQQNKKGEYVFPKTAKCDYVSSDISEEEFDRAVRVAMKALRTDNLVAV